MLNMEGNAFAAASGHRTDHPAKRPKLDDITVPPAPKFAHDDTALEVDVMILDHLIYNATVALLDQRSRQLNRIPAVSLLHHVDMVESFLVIFRSRYPAYRADAELHFRLHLLTLVTMYTQRLTYNNSTPAPPALELLRQHNQERAKRWIGREDRIPSYERYAQPFVHHLPLSMSARQHRRSAALADLGISAQHDDSPFGTACGLSLLDILPTFVEVTVELQILLGSTSNPALLGLLADFMLQACLEKYLFGGDSGTDAIDEAFAWGYEAAGAEALESDLALHSGTEQENVNELFADGGGATESPSWAPFRDAHLSMLFPRVDMSRQEFETHLNDLANREPLTKFERKVLFFLTALTKSLPEPVLAQLETGQLDGMGKSETAVFVKSCGLAVEHFYRSPAGFKGPARS